MSAAIKHEGVVVPMVTPSTVAGRVDEVAVDRMVDRLLAGRVNGIFVLGTTGEASTVPRSERPRFVQRVVARVRSRALVYAGIGDLHPDDALMGNVYLDAGADAVVARPPESMPTSEIQAWFLQVLKELRGPMILYNIPMVTKASIPLELVESLLGHPRLVGVKDSENDPQRLNRLIRDCGKERGVSIFVGVGKLMEQGLRWGAHGIVPSVGNLIPEMCHRLWQCARREDWGGLTQCVAQMNLVAAVYQADRDLGESLATLKGALSLENYCEKYTFPPLRPINDGELRTLATELQQLHLLSEAQMVSVQNPVTQPCPSRGFHTL